MRLADFNRMKLMRENRELDNRVYGDCFPCIVDCYFDEGNQKAYQLDRRTSQYRVADLDGSRIDACDYGEWQKLDRE